MQVRPNLIPTVFHCFLARQRRLIDLGLEFLLAILVQLAQQIAVDEIKQHIRRELVEQLIAGVKTGTVPGRHQRVNYYRPVRLEPPREEVRDPFWSFVYDSINTATLSPMSSRSRLSVTSNTSSMSPS